MINNSNQDIHTDYQAQDVFTPNAANQLTRAISYDFVITQEVLENYVSKHSSLTVIDVGDLIACDAEGNDGSWGTPVKAPVSIYIAGKTSLNDTYCLDFGGKLLTDILDCSDFQSGGSWDSALTCNMVNVYSAYPYRLKELVAGINFWSAPETVVSIVNAYASNAGVTKVGAYSTEGQASLYNLGDSDYLQIVCHLLVSGTHFNINATAAHVETGYRPAVVYADWMNGSNSVTEGYYIYETDTSKPGLFQQLTESVKYGAEPVVFVQKTQASDWYRLCHHETNAMQFANVNSGRTLEVRESGDLTWGMAASGGSGRAVLADFDTAGIITAHKYIVGGTFNLDSLYVLKSNVPGFMTPQEDMARVQPSNPPVWYNASPGFSFENGAITTLDWYFWYAISDFDDADDTTLIWRKNPRLALNVATGTLKEGIVYEINCHVVSLPSGPLSPTYEPMYPDYSVGTNPPMVYGKQATPVTSYAAPGVLDCETLNLKPVIVFQSYQGGTANVRLWGLPDRVIPTYYVYPAFYAAPEPNFGATNMVNAAIQLKDLARAKVLFTYLGGIVYIMSY